MIDIFQNTGVSAKQGGAAGSRQNTNNSPKPGGAQFVDELPGGGETR